MWWSINITKRKETESLNLCHTVQHWALFSAMTLLGDYDIRSICRSHLCQIYIYSLHFLFNSFSSLRIYSYPTPTRKISVVINASKELNSNRWLNQYTHGEGRRLDDVTTQGGCNSAKMAASLSGVFWMWSSIKHVTKSHIDGLCS